MLIRCSYPGTSLERREEPKLSFDTNLEGVSGFNVADTARYEHLQKCTDFCNRACMYHSIVQSV